MVRKFKKKFIFTEILQKKFSLFSNDDNPIHLDRDYSKIFFDNQKIVYGALIVIKSLSYLNKAQFKKIGSLNIDFFKPIYVNQEVNIEIEIKKTEYVFSIYVERDCKVKILAKFEKKKFDQPINDELVKIENDKELLKKLKVNSGFEINKKFKNFSFLKKLNLDQAFLNELGFLSYFVGSVFPGHGAIITNIEVKFSKITNKHNSKKYEIFLKYLNKILNSSVVSIKNNNQYKITSFFIPKKSYDKNKLNFNKIIKKNEFAKTKNLIIGGSRGLGFITANIISSGNGKVFLTYRDNLKKIKKQMKLQNKNSINRYIKFDINHDLSYKKLKNLDLNNLFYFPTSKIFLDKKELFEENIFENFNNFYIYKFYRLCQLFETRQNKINIFFPSTISIQNYKFLGLNEYIMSKSASEVLINNLNRSFKFVKIYVYRLPRLDTDQTSNIMGIKSLNPYKKMLTIVRNFLSKND